MPYYHNNPDKPSVLERFTTYVNQFVKTGLLHKNAYAFIREHRPWEGMHQYGWTVKALVLIAIGIGIYIFSGFFEMITQAIRDPQAFQAGVAGVFGDFSLKKFEWMLDGSTKYLVLIVLEILTFHIVQRTLEIQIGREPDHSFHAFMNAEMRMISVAFISWILESITQLLVGIPLGILGLNFLKEPTGLLIEFYFVGFALIDNYHECFDLKTDESRKRTWEVAGVSVAVGMVAYVLMFVPLIGVVAASMLGAVTATMAMERFLPVTEEEVLAYEEKRNKK